MEPFNNKKYLKLQSEKILERIHKYEGKLYLEFGGKLFDDYHAKRVLPGFEFDNKIRLLESLKDMSEIIICISSDDIEKNKIRADYNITYSMDTLRLIDKFRKYGLKVNSVVITKCNKQHSVELFQKKLESYGIKTYKHSYIENYPSDLDYILSESGYGSNEYIETTMPLVVVTASGPGSGKLSTCMSQLYNDSVRNVKSQYAKFETFPVWNLSLKHPVNIAYEAATADLEDVNMIDPFHLEEYNEVAVNYNRDIELFPVLKKMLSEITNTETYKSPTDMGVNMVGFCIEDDDAVKEAAKQEVIRRYYKAMSDNKKGTADDRVVNKIATLMKDLELEVTDRKVVTSALERSKEANSMAVAIELENGETITGRTNEIMKASASCLLNTIKKLAKINDDILLISENILRPIQELKNKLQGEEYELLDVNDILSALSVCAVTNPTASLALSKLNKLKDLQAHSTYIFNNGEEKTYKNLGIDVTYEPKFDTNNLFVE